MALPGSADSRSDTEAGPRSNVFRERAVITLAPDGTVLTWNAGAQRLNGHLAEDVLGQHFSIFYPEQERDAGTPSRHLREATADGERRYDGLRLHNNGTCFRVRVALVACFDHVGSIEGFTEITLRAGAEPHEVQPCEDELLRGREHLAASLQQVVVHRIIDAGLTLAGTLEIATHPTVVQRVQRAIGTLDETITGIRSLMADGRLLDTPDASGAAAHSDAPTSPSRAHVARRGRQRPRDKPS